MKILTPIMYSEDIDILNPNIYNTEFFCGYLPDWWVDTYNDSNVNTYARNLSTPINNRNGRSANVTNITELKEIVYKAKMYETEVFLVLNAKYYPDYVYENLKRYIEEVISAGITRMIVCDMGMIHFLQKNYPEIRVSVSCLNQVTNTMAVEYYAQFHNVDRIVFPRHMSSEEIAQIVTAFPNMEYEFFIFSNKCLYDDGYCRGVHEFTPICKDLYFSEYYLKNGSVMSDLQTNHMRANEKVYGEWTRNEIQVKEKGYSTASFGCTACSLLKLKEYSNIVSVKMSIRGHGVEERLRQVKMAHEVLMYIRNGNEKKELQNIICKLYGKENLCETGMSCIMI